MYRVHNEQATIILSLCRDANALAGARDLWGRLDRHDCITITVNLDEIVGLLSDEA